MFHNLPNDGLSRDHTGKVCISFPLIEIHGNAKSRGGGGPAEKGLGRHRLGFTPDAPRPIITSFSLTTKVSLKPLMIRNPKDFGVWSAYPSGVHSLITELEMLLQVKSRKAF